MLPLVLQLLKEGGRRTYHLTETGSAHLRERRDGTADPWEEVADSVSEEIVDLHRLLAQVGMAMRQVGRPPAVPGCVLPAAVRRSDPGRTDGFREGRT